MNLGKYGPFANVVAIASALIATFSVFLLKALGGAKRWTWLTSGSPPFLVTGAARALCVGLMAVTYVTISEQNYKWFAAAAVLAGVLAFVAIASFDRLRKIYVWQIPVVAADGKPLLDRKKKEVQENVVVDLESNMRPEAKSALDDARKKFGAVSVRQFMSGYGATRLNDPEALWEPVLLAKTSNRLTITLMLVVLFAVMALFWSAFIIQASGK